MNDSDIAADRPG